MLKLTTPKMKSEGPSRIYYVSSESKPNDPPHIVVRIFDSTNYVGLRRLFFCDCRDFMVRWLPSFGTHLFGYCKHIKFVRDVEDKAGSDQIIEATRTTRGSR